MEQLTALATDISTRLDSECEAVGLNHAPVEIHQGDMLVHDWYDADIIYLSAVLFSDMLLESVTDLFSRLKKGTRVISLKQLPERPFVQIYACTRVQMTWGL